MYRFLPYMTNDFSVGLYCEDANDIYHSAHGALSEAYEKFINPLELKDGIRVLDICYGVGYNTKALLNEFIKRKYKSINIDCVDMNSVLMQISPFINSHISFFDRLLKKKDLYKNIENYNEAKKIVNTKWIKRKSKFRIKKDVNLILYRNLKKSFCIEAENLLRENENHVFFDKSMLRIHQIFSKLDDKLYQNKNKSTYLHNIYYQYISKRYCMGEYDGYNLRFFAQDIRDYLKNSTCKYDIVLLDGFTPQKCPCIWSQDFFEALYNVMDDDAQLVTYNSSAVIRAAMLNAEFKIGNILSDEGNIIGTFAAKNNRHIKNPLSEKQMGLLGTKAGIPYRDKNLELDNEQILMNRKIEIENSNLESSSKYLKRCKNEI